MSTDRNLRARWAAISLAAIGIAAALTALAANPPPDANLFTTYTMGTGYKSISWIVCGSTMESEGCYNFGTLGPFGEAGAMIETYPRIVETTLTRDIYVVDVASGANGKEVELYVYRKTDSISPSTDTATVVLLKSVVLPLVGGTNSKAFIVANTNYLYVGTNLSPVALQILKSDLHATQIGGFSPPVNLSAITTDSYGNVTITFGGFTSADGGFYVLTANGEGVEDGGGANFMLNPITGISTSTLPMTDASVPAARLGVHAKP